jgi:glycosyltransferase involved in cell wall biosynthesis
MRILFLTNLAPYPPRGGVQLRVWNIAKRVARHHEVTIGCHVWSPEEAAGLDGCGLPAVTGAIWAANWSHVAPAVRGAFRGRPPELAQYYSPVIRDLLRTSQFDLVQFEETLLAPYLDDLPRGPKTVLTLHNVHFEQGRRMAGLEGQWWRRGWRKLNAGWMRYYEPGVTARFDRAVAVTEEDRALMLRVRPRLSVDVIPNGVDTERCRPLPEPTGRNAVLFVGTMNYLPCADGAVWFVREILPILRRLQPEMELWIVGRDPTAEVRALAGPGVFVTGEVDDVKPYYERAKVTIAPLRGGGGSRLKILESMAFGRAMVSTTIGAEGLRVRHDEHILIADDCHQFAESIHSLLADSARRQSLTQNARGLVEEHYDWESLASRYLTIYDDLRHHR